MKIVEHKTDKGDVPHVKMNRNHIIPHNENTFYSNYSFAQLVCGPPGSGKTSWVISQMTHSKGLLYKKFHTIHIFSPSLHTVVKEIHLPPNQIHQELDFDELEQILEQNKARVKNGENKQLLLVFDDMITEISKTNNIKVFSKMILNRAHYFASVIITTQTYNKIPLSLRKNFSIITQFKANKKELENVRQEATNFDETEWKALCKYVFETSHSFLTITSNNNFYKNMNLLEIEESDSSSDEE